MSGLEAVQLRRLRAVSAGKSGDLVIRVMTQASERKNAIDQFKEFIIFNRRMSSALPRPRKPRFMGMTLIGLLLAVVIGSLVGLGGYTFKYGEGLSYFSTDPQACVNCHIMQPQFDSWQKASHHGVATCVDCHLPHDFIGKYIAKAENGYYHSKGFTFQDFPEPIFIKAKAARILQDNCLYCHSDLVHDLVSGATSGADDMHCVHCHRSAGHGETVGLGKYEAPRGAPIK